MHMCVCMCVAYAWCACVYINCLCLYVRVIVHVCNQCNMYGFQVGFQSVHVHTCQVLHHVMCSAV